MIDQAHLAQFVAESMDELDKMFEGEAEIGDFMLITEVRHPTREGEDPDDEEGMTTTVLYQSSNLRRHVQIGLLEASLVAAKGNT